MTLPVSIFAAEARFLPRRSHEEPRLSLVVRIGHLPAPVFEGQLADLAAWATDDVEFLVLDEALEGRRRLLMDAFRESDDRVAIVRFSRYRGIPAIGINLALQRASGQWVAYQTGQAALIRGGVERMMAAGETAGGDVVVGGCRAAGEGEGDRAVHFGPMLDAIVHRHRLLEGVGLADPHLLLAEAWGADLAGRLLVGGVTVELPAPDVATHVEGPQYFASAFADARRSESRASELTIGAIARVDVLSDRFLPTGEAHRRYCDELVAPYVSRYWQEGACLHSLVARHLAVGPRLKVRLRGVPALPSVEITYGNFVRTFPECLDLRFSSPKAMGPEFSADDDLVVNFRLSDEIAHDDLHRRARAAGKGVVYAMDDNLLRLSELEFFAHSPNIDEQQINVRAYLEDADQVATWSTHCATDVRPINRRVGILRTNIEARRLPHEASPIPEDGRLIYATLTASAPNKAGWWQSVIGEWADFFRRHRDQARLVLYSADPRTELLYKEWFKGVDYEIHAVKPYLEYLETNASMGFHYVLAHVDDDTEFAKPKCPIKFLEATAAGAILLASDARAYAAPVDYVECIKAAPRAGGWTDALERSLMLGHEGRWRMWRAARLRVERDFTTECQFYPFFQLHETARLQAILGVGQPKGRRRCVLMIEPRDAAKRHAFHSWANLLGREGIDVARVQTDAATMRNVKGAIDELAASGKSPAVVVVPSLRSPWLEIAHGMGLATIAVADITDVPVSTDDVTVAEAMVGSVVTPSIAVVRRLRACGYRDVRRVGGLRIPGRWVRAAVVAPGDGHKTTRVGLVCGPDVAGAEWESCLMAAFSALGIDTVTTEVPGGCDVVIVMGNGMDVLEAGLAAMAAAIPLIAVDSEDIGEIIVEGVNGWSCVQCDVDAVAVLVQQIFGLPPGRMESVVQNAMVTAWARVAEEPILLNLSMAIREAAESTNRFAYLSDEAGNGDEVETQVPTDSVFGDQIEPAESTEAEMAALASLPDMEQLAELRRWMGEGRLLSALAGVKQALMSFPKFVPLLTLAGQLYLRMGEAAEAEANLLKAVALNPKRNDALAALARVAEGRSDWGLANEYWERCLAASSGHPNFSAWSLARAIVLMELRRFDEAETVVEGILRVDPGNVAGCEGFARIAEKRQDWHAAIERYRRCLDDFPHSPKVFAWRAALANSYLHIGDLDAAEAEYRSIADAYPERPAGATGIGWVAVLRSAQSRRPEEK